MAYRDFKREDLKTKFGIQESGVYLFDEEKIRKIAPSESLLIKLGDAKYVNLSTEKALSECVVSPILVEIRKHNADYQIFSGETITGDKSLGLNGEIDFLFAKIPITTKPDTPIFCVVEAKIGRVIEAFPQATAQMLGVRFFNKKYGNPIEIVHAIVTDGTTWRVLKLEDQTLFVDQNSFSINNLPVLLGVLQAIVDFYKK